MSGSNRGMVPKSKNKKFSPKKEFIVETRETGATKIAETVGVEPGTSQLQESAMSSALTEVTGEERHQLISEAAYFRAERRNFIPGCELEDWLDAEAEINTKLSKIGPSIPPREA